MSEPSERFIQAIVLGREIIDASSGLCELRLDVVPEVAHAGQFVCVGVEAQDGVMVERFISLASPPGAPARLLVQPGDVGFVGDPSRLDVGDVLHVSAVAAGQLTLAEVPARPTLWLLAAGTGLAPMAAILAHGVPVRFGAVVLVHAVRRPGQLAYRAAFEAAAAESALRYLPVVSGDGDFRGPQGRIPALIDAGRLAEAAGVALDGPSSAALICGSAEMVVDVRAALARAGLDCDPARRIVVTEF